MDTFAGSDTSILFIDGSVTKENSRRAYFDPEVAAQALPKLKIRVVYGRESTGLSVWASWKMEEAAKDPSELFGGQKARDIKVVQAEKGNHLMFWDYPDVALKAYQHCVDI